jgi:uncharacterized protein YkwD
MPAVRSRVTATLLSAGLFVTVLAASGCGDGNETSPPSKIGQAVVAVQTGKGTKAKLRRQRPTAIGYPQLGLHPPVGVGDQRAQCTDTDAIPSRDNIAQIKAAILCLHNAERQARGLGPLKLNDRLTAAAQGHATDMVRAGYFGHETLRGVTFITRIRKKGFKGFPIGENIAAGDGEDALPGAIMHSWMTSSGHRANILNPRFKEIGIGVFAGFPGDDEASEGGTYVTNFGTSRRR